MAIKQLNQFAVVCAFLGAMNTPAVFADSTSSNQVNAATFNGYKLYRVWCARCHGTYGQGLAAPNLAESLNKLSREAFMDIIAPRQTSRNEHKPSWRKNNAVMNGKEDIYRYLKARANGTLDPVQPELSR